MGHLGLARGVVEAQQLAVAAGLGQRGEHGGVEDRRALPRAGRLGLRGDRVHLAAQPRRHQGQHLRERLHRPVVHPGDGAGRRRTQPDGDRDRLLVLEQQRRERPAGAQLVAAGGAADGVDGVAELAQPVDVAAQRPRAHLEPVGELRARPVAVGLEQGQQPQHPLARAHVLQNNPNAVSN